MIFELLICVFALGLVVYLEQRRLEKLISETAEDYGKVFSDNDIVNLKMMLIPMAGCLLIASLWTLVMFNVWKISEKIIILGSAIIVEGVLGFVYIKYCTKSAQDFQGYGNKLFNVVRLFTFVPVIVGIGIFLFLLSTGYHIPYFWLIAALMIVSFIPVYKNYPSLKDEFKNALKVNNVGAISEQTVQSTSVNETISQGKTEKLTKRCPYCGEKILAVAKKCKHCGEWLNND